MGTEFSNGILIIASDMRRITDRDIDRLIREELTHTQVKSDISDYIGTRDFEKKIKEICADCFDNYFKEMWTRKSLWIDAVKRQ